jgi:hypothetical protein
MMNKVQKPSNFDPSYCPSVAFSLELKRSERKPDHLLTFSGDVKNTLSFTSTPTVLIRSVVPRME